MRGWGLDLGDLVKGLHSIPLAKQQLNAAILKGCADSRKQKDANQLV